MIHLIHSAKQKTAVLVVFCLLLVIALPIIFVEKIDAANLTQAYVRLDRLADGATTGGMICAKATTTDVETMVKVTFPTGFATVDTPANWTVTTTNIPTDATAWIGIGTSTTATGQDVTFPSGDMVVGTLYCFNFTGTSTLTNAGAGNNLTGIITTQKAGPTTIDSSNYALSIISNDQIVVTATVPATFTFVLSGVTDDALGTLSDSSIVSSPTPRTVTITTNAAAGWVAWVKSANAALNSASTGANIATAGTVNNTPEDLDSVTGYVLDVDKTTDASGGCTLQQNPGYGDEYDGTDATQGGSLSTTFQPIAECVSGTANGDIITLTNRVKIATTQAAATDYTDTLTVVAAGRF